MKLTRKNLLLAASAVFTAALTAPSVQAVDFYWDGNTGNWSESTAPAASRWSTAADGLTNPAGIPNSTTTANLFFNITSKNTSGSDISLGNSSRNAASLTFDTTGTTNFRAGGNSAAASTLNIGAGGITINALAGNVVLGVTPSSFGTLTVAMAADQIWTNNGAGTLTSNAAVTGGAGIDLTKSGTGTVRLNGLNTYVGTTTVNNGILQIANYDALDTTSSIIVSGGGTSNLQLVQVGTGTTSNSINKALSLHGTLSTAGGSGTNRLNQTWVGNITLAGNSTITNNGNSLFDIDGQIDLASHTLTFATDGTNSRVDGNIIGTGGSFNKTSAQNLTLFGTNTYTGKTTVTSGRLQFAKQVSLYNNAAAASWSAANIVVANTGVLSLNVGGTGEFTTSDVTTLLTNLGGANGTSTTGFAAGSGIAFDTVNAAGGTFTVADAIADSTGTGGGAINLTKLGAATTLVLTNSNSYSGSTTVLGGTLRLENATALGNTSSVTLSSTSTTLSIGTDTALAGPRIVTTAGTIVSDRATTGAGPLGAGLTHAFSGISRLGSGNTNITAGANVTSGTAAIQFASLDNDNGTTANFGLNPTTANAIVTGGVNMGGGLNAGTANFTLGGTGSVNSIGGAIVNGARVTANLIKSGDSTWALDGDNTYNGTTAVNGGTLIINGNSSTATGAVTVAGGATLGGIGTVGGNTTITGVHSPGNSPGVITHGANLTYEAGASVLWELVANSTAGRGTNFDGINVGGVLDFNGSTTLNLNFNFGSSAVEWQNAFWDSDYTGTSGWLVYSGATSLDGFPANLALNLPAQWLDESGDALLSIRSGASFSLFQDSNNIYLNYSAIPEPRAALLGGLGLLALLRRRR